MPKISPFFPPSVPDVRKPKVLLIDDSPSELRRLMDHLQVRYQLCVAMNGQQGYQQALVLHPQLILLDVYMPRMDGFATCRLLKANPATRDIPIIFLTMANKMDERLAGLTQGGVDYIAKPFVEEEVCARVAIHLGLTTPSPSPCPTSEPLTPEHVLVAATLQLLSTALHLPWTMSDIAQRVGTHEKRLAQVFRAQTGKTVFTYLRDLRLQRACHCLIHSAMSVQEIAEQTGFQNAASFSTAFREQFGMSPRIYRLANIPCNPSLAISVS